MTDQPTDDGHVHHVEGEDPQTAALRDAVNENRQRLGIDPPTVVFGHHDHTEPTGAAMIYDRAGRLDLKWVDRAAHVTATPEVIEGFVEQVNRLRAEVAAWKVKCARKDTEIESEVFRRDRAEHQLTEIGEERDRLTAWSDELAHRVPESYEGGEGTQEACINSWIADLDQVAGPFAEELRAHADVIGGIGDLIVPIPADPVAVEHLYDAAARLGGE